MDYFEDLALQYQIIKKRLVDEESIMLYEARVKYAITRDIEELEKLFFDREKEWRCEELENFLNGFSRRKDIILFGAGKIGRTTKQYLEVCGYFPICYCDNKITGVIDGIPVISVNKLIKNQHNAVIIICSQIYRKEMYEELLKNGYPAENILIPGGNRIQIYCGKQYFDLFQPQQKEVFIDAGSFDGNTVVDFFSWFNGNKKDRKCYSLEPVTELYNSIIERCKREKWENVIIQNLATWDKEEIIYLTKDRKENNLIWGGSCVGKIGETMVIGKPIDNICSQNEDVTFIKMDIEGAELKALQGAKNIILKNRPRLAISIYHKPLDIIEIPSYILSLIPEYKLYIRQYAADFTETILYAEV